MTEIKNIVFDYRALRLLMGIIALALPFVVIFLSSGKLSSISASYHAEARDAFVGMLFVVSAFLFAYNGHSSKESIASKAASLAAISVALFPTSCNDCMPDITTTLHLLSAALLFSILTYFCFVPFRNNTKGQPGKKGLRSKIYFACGWIMIGCMLSILLGKLILTEDEMKAIRLMFLAEATSLCAFGFAWIVSGKYFRLFADDDEALR